MLENYIITKWLALMKDIKEESLLLINEIHFNKERSNARLLCVKCLFSQLLIIKIICANLN